MTKCHYCGRTLTKHERYCYHCEQDLSKVVDAEEKISMPTPHRYNLKKDINEFTSLLRRIFGKKEVTAFCVKCKKKVIVPKPTPYFMKNGKKAVRGICPHCKRKVFRILPTSR